jgi:hypothetical protein
MMMTKATRRGWSQIVALGVLCALVACAPHGGKPGESEEIPGEVPAPGGIKFSVRVAPLRFAAGDRVSLEASLFNDSEDTFKKKYPTHCIWGYALTTLDGVSLERARECVPQDSTMVLAPGELRMIVREWSGRERYFNANQPLAVGKYQVVAGFLDKDFRVVPMSAPVEIEIMPRRGGR